MLIHRPRPLQTPWKWPEGKPKPKLTMIHLPHFRVHHADLEMYLGAVYRMQGFDFFKATGFTPGLIPEYSVTGKLPPAWESKNKAARIRSGQRTGDIGLVLNVLCLDGFIPAGRYLIDTKPKPKPKPIEIYRALLEKYRDPLAGECVQYREKHQSDPDFRRQAAAFDKAVAEWLQSQQ